MFSTPTTTTLEADIVEALFLNHNPAASQTSHSTSQNSPSSPSVTVINTSRVSGGDSNDAFKAKLSDGRTVFVKTNPRPLPDQYNIEANDLAWISQQCPSVNVPAVIGVSESVLVLEWLNADSSPNLKAQQDMGRNLARLHKTAISGPFGREGSGILGSIVMQHSQSSNWALYYGQRLLKPLIEQALRKESMSHDLGQRIWKVIEDLHKLIGPEDHPALVHGDLWAGNWLGVGDKGYLVDPAAFVGHREIDLAMMKLFGGFPPPVWEAYEDEYPLSKGFDERVPLYQLYPLLAHVVMFGSGYCGQVDSCLKKLGY